MAQIESGAPTRPRESVAYRSLLATGLGVALVGLLARGVAPAETQLVRGTAAALGTMLAAFAVRARFLRRDDGVEDRLLTAGVITFAGMVSLVGSFALDPAWDTSIVVLRVLTGIALGGAILWVLPPLGRKVAVSVLLLFHFGGILTAVTAVEPPNQPAPWISQQLWARVYRPYLEFMYLNNAYHFYSPDPGPAQLLWFRIEYTDNTHRWFKIPNRKESPIGMHYQRMLSITESTNSKFPQLPPDMPHRQATYWRMLRALSAEGANLFEQQNPTVQILFQIPTDYARDCLASYVRYAARQFPHPDSPPGDADATVRCIEVYRVTHQIMLPQDMARGGSPLDKGLLAPYFMGEYDATGKLLDPNDPLLYWLLPNALKTSPTGPSREINFVDLASDNRAKARERAASERAQP